MTVGDHEEFLKTLSWGEELEVGFRGRRYLIQGHTKGPRTREPVAHMEVFEIPSGDFLWETDSATMSACATSFLNAEIWEGMSFVRAEPEVEWLD